MKINLEYDEVIFDKNFRKELFKNKIDNFIRIDYLMFLIFRNLRLMFLFFLSNLRVGTFLYTRFL